MIVRILLLLAATLSFGGIAHAGDKPLYGPAPGWVLAAPAIDPATLTDADPIFLRMDQQHRLEKGLEWTYGDLATRIASPQLATQLGTIQLPWVPEQGDLTIHSVEILRGGERIDLIASGARFTVLQREQNLERAFLSGILTATLSVEGLRVGDVLRLAFSITSREGAFPDQIQSIAPLFGDPMRIGFGRVRMMWPVGETINWRSHIKSVEVKTSEANGWREISVALPLTKQPEMPTDAPMRFQPLQLLEAGSFVDWRRVSALTAPLYRTQGTIAPGSPLAAEVAKIRNASSDPRVRAAMALQLVQDKVRYLYRGMENGNYVPQSPAQTWTARFGDCKAKTLLLLAILHELGIEAVPAMVSHRR